MAKDKGKPETIAVHAEHMSAEHFGAVNTPVYRVSTILFPTLDALESDDKPYVYGRRGTPSSRSLEDAVTALEGGVRTVLCPSGANAIATTKPPHINTGMPNASPRITHSALLPPDGAGPTGPRSSSSRTRRRRRCSRSSSSRTTGWRPWR